LAAGNVTGTNCDEGLGSLAARAAASSFSMKISASMAVLHDSPLQFRRRRQDCGSNSRRAPVNPRQGQRDPPAKGSHTAQRESSEAGKGSHSRHTGPIPGFWEEISSQIDKTQETPTPTRPPVRGEGVCTGPSQQNQKPKSDFSDFSVFLCLLDCLRTAKLFTNSKFCMIFVALIPVMNYYA
jgi:hypothetical protein